MIKALKKPDWQVTSEFTEMQQMALDFYKQLYTSEGVQGVEDVLQHVPAKVTPEMNETLLALFEAKEVKAALFQMFPTKAPARRLSSSLFSEALGYLWRNDD